MMYCFRESRVGISEPAPRPHLMVLFCSSIRDQKWFHAVEFHHACYYDLTHNRLGGTHGAD